MKTTTRRPLAGATYKKEYIKSKLHQYLCWIDSPWAKKLANEAENQIKNCQKRTGNQVQEADRKERRAYECIS